MRWTLMLPLIAGAVPLGFADGPTSRKLGGANVAQTATTGAATTQTSGHKYPKLGSGRLAQRFRNMRATANADRTQIEEIVQQAESDIQTLETTAYDSIAVLLTDGQKADFTVGDLRGEALGPGGPQGPGFGLAPGNAEGMVSNETADQENAERDARMFLRNLGQLALTADQRTQIQSRLDASQTDVQKLIDQAHSDIQAVLSSAQTDTRSATSGGTRMGHHHGEMTALTADERSRIEAIQAQLEQDITQSRSDAEAQIRPMLTADQQTQLSMLESQQAREWTATHGTPLERLTATLTLTADQQAQIAPILDQLQTDIQARRQQARSDIEAVLGSKSTSGTGVTTTTGK